jgi:lysyl-tRNA synthetase, class I
MTAAIQIPDDIKSWPFVEARKLVERLAKRPTTKGYALLETGYGPSGLPHIGTFGEVARTAMVRHAFSMISDIPTRLFAYSDDMDGFRKVPTNLPNQEMLAQHLGKPLTTVPDPFGTHESLGHHNNARLRAFLDAFEFEYEFQSATERYKSGDLDDTLLKVLANYDKVIEVILPTLGAERQATYSPFLPVCPKTGIVLQVPVVERNVDAGTIVYDDQGTKIEIPVTGGHCKLQWKADWAMRWAALDVDYEMYGKDLIDSVRLSSRICRILGGQPPEGFAYELFLDEEGAKISKSKGNGLTIDEWLRYASPESLSLYMYQNPKKAKRLYFDVIPKNVDEYINHLHKYPDQDDTAHLGNPVWHIHGGNPPAEEVPLSFSILLNLASACNSEDKTVLWGFISRYQAGATADNHPILDRLLGYAIAYYQDFVKPHKCYRAPTDQERVAMEDLVTRLKNLGEPDGETLQHEVYEVGKSHGFENLRDWFRGLYEILFGQSQGPRIGSFFALYGVEESVTLIDRALAGEDLS